MSKDLVSFLYRLARTSNDIKAVFNLVAGNPKKAIKRLTNKYIGRFVNSKTYWR